MPYGSGSVRLFKRVSFPSDRLLQGCGAYGSEYIDQSVRFNPYCSHPFPSRLVYNGSSREKAQNHDRGLQVLPARVWVSKTWPRMHHQEPKRKRGRAFQGTPVADREMPRQARSMVRVGCFAQRIRNQESVQRVFVMATSPEDPPRARFSDQVWTRPATFCHLCIPGPA